MRDSLNYNMLPIAQDNFNCISDFRGFSITTNGYYGFHPAPMQQNKKEEEASNDVEMDVFEFEQETRRCNDEIHRLINRKRAWELPGEHREFKKRRQNENIVNIKKKVANTKDSELIEELLKETHGCSVYHWFSDDL